MTKNLTKALKEQRKKTEQFKRPIWGTLGIKLNGFQLVDVPNRPSFVYVQLEDNPNENIQAFNNRVAPSYGLPVILKRDGTRYIVTDVDTARYQNNWPNNAPFLPRHGPTHSFDPDTGGGADMVWVFSKQFMPLLVYPSGSNSGPTVLISPHVLLTSSGTFSYVGNTGVPNLTTYLPTGGGAIMALIYLDKNTGNPGIIINSGSNFSSLFTTAAQVTPYIPALTSPATQIPLGAVRLVTGTSILDWSYIYDVRQFVQAQSTGTSGGGGGGSSVDTIGFAGLYEGIPLGTGTFLNVRGNAVSFTKSGSMFDLFVTGSTGGGTVNPPVTGTVVVQNDGQTLGSVTTLNFRDTLYAYVSGTVAEVLISGTSSTYMRVGQPTSLSSVTGQYWVVPDRIYATGSLAVFNQGHDLIPGIDYAEQYANSGTFQYISTPPTGTYNLVIYGVPATGGGTNGGGSSLTLLKSVWNPDAPPDSPSATNSEFNNGSGGVPSGFTEYDPGSLLTVTESASNKNVQLLASTTAVTLDILGIYKSIPAGDFTIWTSAKFLGTSTNYSFIGLCLWEDATDSSKKIAGYGLSPRNSGLMDNGLYTWTNWNSFNAATETNFQWVGPRVYIRLRRNGTTYRAAFSSDGIAYFESASALNPGFTPTHFGVGIGNTTGANELAIFDFFRYTASDVGTVGLLAGQLAGIYQ